jgi:hypothetical protein
VEKWGEVGVEGDILCGGIEVNAQVGQPLTMELTGQPDGACEMEVLAILVNIIVKTLKRGVGTGIASLPIIYERRHQIHRSLWVPLRFDVLLRG